MKTLPTQAGPFTERPYFEDHEMESMALDELRRVALLPTSPGRVRIDRFIEKRFRVVPSYEDLDTGVLGYTKFGPDGAEKVVVSRSLSEEGTQVAERRERSTLAHESGHILLHGFLFGLQPLMKSDTFFKDDVDLKQRTVLCRDEGRTRSGYDGRWWEFQANKMIGPLLLPRPLLVDALDGILMSSGMLGTRTLDASRRGEAVQHLAEIFDVNPVVARRRLDDIFPIAASEQLTL